MYQCIDIDCVVSLYVLFTAFLIRRNQKQHKDNDREQE